MHQNTTILQNQNNNWLILSASNWDDLQVSNHFLSQELAKKGHIVYYVESPGVIGLNFKRIAKIIFSILSKTNIKEQFKASGNNHSSKLKTNLNIIKKISIPILGLPFVDQFIFLIYWKKNKRIHSMIEKSDKILICSPIWIKFFRDLQWKRNFKKDYLAYYHLVDDVESYKHLFFYLKKLKHFLPKLDGIISPNENLINKYQKYNKSGFLVPHGFCKVLDDSFYLDRIFKRDDSIVYAGTFADWCDYDLIKKICIKFKNHKIFLIGRPAKNISKKFLDELSHGFSNLIIKNSLNRKELHCFLLKCSVAIIPYKAKNLHIKFSSPSKIMDYLGCGLPVISTDIPYCDKHPYVEIAKDFNFFVSKIKDCLKINNHQRLKMVNYALENQWENNVSKLCESLINEI
tara:strand:+ start:1459 stop:2667 length:1209 start_codon:yes stop_codon:yes gene_type:complete